MRAALGIRPPPLAGRERVGSLGSVRSSILLFALLLVALHLSAEF